MHLKRVPISLEYRVERAPPDADPKREAKRRQLIQQAIALHSRAVAGGHAAIADVYANRLGKLKAWPVLVSATDPQAAAETPA